MGGFGSGRQDGKSVVTDMWTLDVRKVQRAGRLTSGQWFNGQWSRNGEPVANIVIHTGTDAVTLDYRSRDCGGEWQSMSYEVRGTGTPCNDSGRRAWWLSPAVSCGRRVAVLYDDKIYACGHCHQLTYRTQREQAHDQATTRADNIWDQLRWEPGILNGNGGRPKGMHWTTFDRLVAQRDALVNQSLVELIARFGKSVT